MRARRDNYAVAPFAASQYLLDEPLFWQFTRKAPMRSVLELLLIATLLAMTAGLARADAPRIGLAVPLDGPNAPLGRQMREGAHLAATQAGAQLIVADDGCSAEGGQEAARKLVQAKVAIIVGFLCTEAIEAALPTLKDAGIAVITPGVRVNGLTDQKSRTGWLVWRLAPRADAEAGATAKILLRHWRDQLFAIVDDGTLYGRDLAESLRLEAELAGLEPVFVDTFRPQMQNQIALVSRLARAGATHIFVGGDRDDIAIMARDAESLGHELVFAGGEALRAPGDVALAKGTLMIGLPEWANQLDDAAKEHFAAAGIIAEGYVLPAYAAVEIALQALQQAQNSGERLIDSLGGETFNTVLGSISFDAKGDLAQNPFILQRYDGKRFLPVE